MQSSVLTTVLMPVALAVIMLGLGLALTRADFARVMKVPRAVLVGLGCQMILLPIICFGLVKLAGLPAALAVGMMLLAASPGGVTANLFSHLAHGDVALNITLTAVNSLLSVLSVPLIVNLSAAYFMDAGQQIPLQFGKTLQIFAIVLIPVAIGMTLRSRYPRFAERMDRPVRALSAVFLLLVIVATVYSERAILVSSFAAVGLVALAFNVASMVTGYVVPRLVRLNKAQSIAIGMEIGIHNATLAIAVATSLLQNGEMAIPGAVYGVIMFFTAAAFGFLVNRVGVRPATAPSAT